jgi:type I restriction enzyme S subunit
MARAFVYFAFRNEAMRKQLESLSYGVAQQNLSPVKMSGLPFANPPINLLRQFAEFAEPIIDQLLGLKQHNQKLKQARDLLLPKLMSGEITV